MSTLRISATTALLALSIAAPGRADRNTRWIPAASHAPGAAGSTWRTDLSILNTCTAPIAVELRLHRPEGVASRTLSVAPGAQETISDVVATLVTGDATGSLEVAPAGPALVFSRTYNAATSGTFGQPLEGFEAADGLSSGDSAFLLQLSENGAFRTNLGLLNTGSSAAAVDVRLRTATGDEVGSFHESLPPGLLVAVNRPYSAKFGRSDVSGGWAQIDVSAGSGVLVYGSVVDNSTGDPTTVPMRRATRSCATTGGTDTKTIDLGGGVPLTLVRVRAATFLMGSPLSESGRSDNESPQRAVTITKDYWLAKTEVTEAQWLAVMSSNPSGFQGCPSCPVEQVSWSEICGGVDGSHCTASSFVGRVNRLLGTEAYRLPTEAEWENAARAGSQDRFPFLEDPPCGNGCEPCGSAEPFVVWCADSGGSTKPVESQAANPYGLVDLSGNVAEWVADWYGGYGASSTVDPKGPSTGTWRVVRGGDWSSGLAACRSAARSWALPDYRKNKVGFRIAAND